MKGAVSVVSRRRGPFFPKLAVSVSTPKRTYSREGLCGLHGFFSASIT